MQPKRMALALALAFPITSPALAQGTSNQPAVAPELPTVTVTATSREQPISDVQAAVEVITSKT